MKEKLQELVSQYGYAGIFSLLMLGIVGLPVPDETLLALVGFLASKGELHLLPTILVAFLGSACGITVSYLIGRFLGMWFVRKFGLFFHLSPERLQRVENWFERSGRWALVFGYFLPGIRHLTAVVAGSSRLPVRIFALFAYGGALIWATSFIFLGYFLGEHWEKVIGWLESPPVLALILTLLVSAAGFVIWRKIRARHAASS
jgi:membrane protein DedA with SNARE-associated domain